MLLLCMTLIFFARGTHQVNLLHSKARISCIFYYFFCKCWTWKKLVLYRLARVTRKMMARASWNWLRFRKNLTRFVAPDFRTICKCNLLIMILYLTRMWLVKLYKNKLRWEIIKIKKKCYILKISVKISLLVLLLATRRLSEVAPM